MKEPSARALAFAREFLDGWFNGLDEEHDALAANALAHALDQMRAETLEEAAIEAEQADYGRFSVSIAKHIRSLALSAESEKGKP